MYIPNWIKTQRDIIKLEKSISLKNVYIYLEPIRKNIRTKASLNLLSKNNRFSAYIKRMKQIKLFCTAHRLREALGSQNKSWKYRQFVCSRIAEHKITIKTLKTYTNHFISTILHYTYSFFIENLNRYRVRPSTLYHHGRKYKSSAC